MNFYFDPRVKTQICINLHNTLSLSSLFHFPIFIPFPSPFPLPRNLHFVLNSTAVNIQNYIIPHYARIARCDTTSFELELFGTLNHRLEDLFSVQSRDHTTTNYCDPSTMRRKTLYKPRDKSEIHCIFFCEMRKPFERRSGVSRLSLSRFLFTKNRKKERKKKVNNRRVDNAQFVQEGSQ